MCGRGQLGVSAVVRDDLKRVKIVVTLTQIVVETKEKYKSLSVGATYMYVTHLHVPRGLDRKSV